MARKQENKQEVDQVQPAKNIEFVDLLGVIDKDVEMNYNDVVHALGRRLLLHSDEVVYTINGNVVTPSHEVERGMIELNGQQYAFVV